MNLLPSFPPLAGLSACPHQPHLPPDRRSVPDLRAAMRTTCLKFLPIRFSIPDWQPARRAFSAATHFLRSFCCVEVSYAPRAVSCPMQEWSHVIHQPGDDPSHVSPLETRHFGGGPGLGQLCSYVQRGPEASPPPISCWWVVPPIQSLHTWRRRG